MEQTLIAANLNLTTCVGSNPHDEDHPRFYNYSVCVHAGQPTDHRSDLSLSYQMKYPQQLGACRERVGPMPQIYVRPISTRLLPGISTPATRATKPPLHELYNRISPCRCLCLGFGHKTATRPFLRITLQTPTNLLYAGLYLHKHPYL